MPDVNWYDAADLQHLVLKPGQDGAQVELLQHSLNDAGFRLVVDGQYGPATERAVRHAQRRMDLVVDGIAGPKTLDGLDHLEVDHLLGQTDIERAADSLGVDVPAVLAVNEVESRGSGFLDSGLPVILFERHWMYRLMERQGADMRQHVERDPAIVNPKPGGYRGGSAEHGRLENARKLDESSAIQSASWGLFQIMGFHYATLGFSTPQEMELAAQRSEGDQLDMFVAFIKANPAMHQALKRHDWAGFAERYNGPAYHINSYDTRMANAYARHSASERENA